jgi:hypothetical protein
MKITLLSTLLLSFLTLISPKPGSLANYSIALPQQGDWTDHGQILQSGAEGDWDLYLWGGFASSIVKKDGKYYLYYQGSNGYDEVEDTVKYRAIGVATSDDGIHFTKHPSNPVLTWFPQNQLEEGAVSSAASLSAQGEVILYYGANTSLSSSLVNADGRLAVSKDGINFNDTGKVLDHNNRSVWGNGDELFPVIGFSDQERWFVYYIPNGVPQSGMLGVAWGNRRDRLENSSAVLSGGNNIAVWGPGGFAEIGHGAYALFTSNIRAPGGATVEVRTLTVDKPNILSEPVAKYRFEDVSNATVLLDMDRMTWFMYYRSSDHQGYGVKTAPVKPVPGTTTVKMDEFIFLPLLRR